MLFAIGDIHGHFDKLMTLMRFCREFAKARNEHHAEFILLGDYVDRGPASRQVLEFLDSKPENLRCICGNHEDFMLGALDGGTALADWLSNGGGETLASYGVQFVRQIPASHLNLIASLPTHIDDGVRLFVHAGIDPQNPQARERRTLLWTRKHPPEEQVLDRFLVHGHTPVPTGKPELKRNRLNLDTGAGWGRRLSAAAFKPELPHPVAFLNDRGDVSILPAPEHA